MNNTTEKTLFVVSHYTPLGKQEAEFNSLQAAYKAAKGLSRFLRSSESRVWIHQRGFNGVVFMDPGTVTRSWCGGGSHWVGQYSCGLNSVHSI